MEWENRKNNMLEKIDNDEKLRISVLSDVAFHFQSSANEGVRVIFLHSGRRLV